VRGLVPEIDGSAITTELLGGAIQHHGGVLVRGLLSTSRVEQLHEDLRRAFAACGGTNPDPDWHSPFIPDVGYPLLESRRQWVEDCGAIWAADSPPAMYDLVEALQEANLPKILGGYLGETPILSVNKCTMRDVSPHTFSSWHQDGAFLGEGVRTIDVWIALTECGGDTSAPGLSLVPKRIDYLLPIGDGTLVARNGIGANEVLKVLDGRPPADPHFLPGDAMLFDGLFVHATGTKPGLTENRAALETWFFTPATFPPVYVPIAI
jgi:hypothetical protein